MTISTSKELAARWLRWRWPSWPWWPCSPRAAGSDESATTSTEPLDDHSGGHHHSGGHYDGSGQHDCRQEKTPMADAGELMVSGRMRPSTTRTMTAFRALVADDACTPSTTSPGRTGDDHRHRPHTATTTCLPTRFRGIEVLGEPIVSGDRGGRAGGLRPTRTTGVLTGFDVMVLVPTGARVACSSEGRHLRRRRPARLCGPTRRRLGARPKRRRRPSTPATPRGCWPSTAPIAMFWERHDRRRLRLHGHRRSAGVRDRQPCTTSTSRSPGNR